MTNKRHNWTKEVFKISNKNLGGYLTIGRSIEIRLRLVQDI